MLEEKIPRQQAEHARNMQTLEDLFEQAKVKHAAELAALDKQLQAATDANKLSEQQVQFYKSAYEVCVNAPKRSFGCWCKKFISFGGWKCH